MIGHVLLALACVSALGLAVVIGTDWGARKFPRIQEYVCNLMGGM